MTENRKKEEARVGERAMKGRLGWDALNLRLQRAGKRIFLLPRLNVRKFSPHSFFFSSWSSLEVHPVLKSVKEEAAKGRSSSSRRRRNGSLEKLRWYNTARQGRELKELGGVEYNKKRDSILLSLSLFLSLYLLNVRAKKMHEVWKEMV